MNRRSKWVSVALPGISAAALAWAAYAIATGAPIRPRVDAPLPPASRPNELSLGDRDLASSYIGATGIAEPSSEPIELGVPVAGVIERVAVKAGDDVQAGTVLLEIDRRTATAALAARQQELAVAEAQLAEGRAKARTFKAQADAADAQVAAARADAVDATLRLRMVESLPDPRAVSAEDRSSRRAVRERAEAEVTQAMATSAARHADLALLVDPDGHDGPTVRVLAAQAEQARAAVDQARTDLELHTVRSPVAGRVLRVNVRPGQFAVAGVVSDPLMVLGVVNPIHIRASIDEADLGRFEPGLPAIASPRGDARRRAKARFVRVEPQVIPKRNLTGDGSERVDTRVLEVIYAVDPDQLGAYVGQQVDLFVSAKPINTEPEVTERR